MENEKKTSSQSRKQTPKGAGKKHLITPKKEQGGKEIFLRLKDVTSSSDCIKAYQVEVVTVKENKIVGRFMHGKPNAVNLTFSEAMNLLDPRVRKEAFDAT